jgi:tetratricopeptide (TPR) repeat protein/predicted Ser/Thr protein kinase
MIGQKISHYKILEKLGEGGMGVVYKAEDTKLKRTVALKFIVPNILGSGEDKKRFVNEAQAAAALSHPHISTIYEIDEVKGKTFIAMEFIEGQSLREKIKVAPLKLGEALDTSIQIAEGLQEAHERKIVHRDIKSSNIMVTEKGQAKITDFGLAKSAAGTKLTKTATVMGTIAYMSPEQAYGEKMDQRSDIWSLGIVLYEMLTGQLPFQGVHDQLVLYSILNTNPEPITSLRSGVPLELERIVNKCLEKDPNERYQTAADLKADLLHLRRELSTGVTVIPTTTMVAPRPFPKLLPRIAIPLGLVILILLLLLAIPSARYTLLGWLGIRTIPAEMGLAVLPFHIVRGESTDQAFCDGLVEILTSKLTQLERFQESLWVVPSREVHEQEITSPGKARRALGTTLVITESWQRINGEILLTLNLIETKKPRILRSRDIKVPIADISALQDDIILKVAKMLEVELQPQTLNVLTAGGTTVPEASEFYLRGRGYLKRYEDEVNVDAAISMFKLAIERDSSYALAYAGLGEAYWRMWSLTKDPSCVEQAQSHCNRAIELSESLASPVQVTLGILHRDTGKYEEAVEEFQKALQVNPEDSDVYRELALAYEKLGRLEDSEAAYKKAIELKPDYWSGYSHLGAFYYYQARYSEAEKMWQKVIELTPDNIRVYFNLGALYIKMGQTDRAIAMLTRSLEIKPNWLAASNLGTWYFFQGKYNLAMRMFEKAIELGVNNYTVWGNLADTYRYTSGYQEKSEEAYQKAIQLAQKELGINPKDGLVLSRLARYYAASGNIKKALVEISEARKFAPDNVEVLQVSIRVYELANQREQALQLLEEYIKRGGSMEEISRDPDLSELRKDQRYRQLVKKERASGSKSSEIKK